jgi:putative ABC transport system ATP-binding protein
MKAQNDKNVLNLVKVNKIYRMGGEDLYALRDINFTIKKGDFISILGPSGSGKSTLLHIMGLLDRPTSGDVYIDDIETSRMPPNEHARIRGQKIGFVFQNFNLISSLTALENVELPMVLGGAPAAERTARAKQTLNELSMGDRLYHYPNQLSGGQKQRVAIARALINNPEIILADEPTGNLDSKSGKEVLGIFEELHHKGRTVVIITHDQNITKVTHRTIRITDGRLMQGV